MNRNAWRVIALAVLGPVLLSAPSAAEDGGGRSNFSYGIGNRALSMGGAYVAVSNDASAPVWNPGGLGLVPRREVQFSRTSMYGLDINEEFLGFVYPNWRWGAAAITVRHIGVSGIETRDERNVVGDDFSDSQTQVMLSYGKNLGNAWSMGGSVKFQRQSLADATDAGFGADMGLLVYPGLALGSPSSWAQRFSFGISLNNIVEPSLKLDQESVSDPLFARIGAAYHMPMSGGRNLLLAVDVEEGKNAGARVHAGVEFRLHPLLAVRGGMNDGVMSGGAGVLWRDLGVDYAYENNDLGALHRVGLTLNFGASMDESRLIALQAEEEALQAQLEEAFARRQDERLKNLVSQAQAAMTEGRYRDASDLLDAAHTLEPDRQDLHVLRAQALYELAKDEELSEEYTRAAVLYDQVVQLDPQHRAAADGAARCRQESDLRARRTQELRQQFAAALDAFSAGELLTARTGFSSILKIDPQDADAQAMLERTDRAIRIRTQELTQRAGERVDAGQFGEAESLIAQAVKLSPGSRDITRLRARIQEAKKREQEALASRRSAPTSTRQEAKPKPVRRLSAQKKKEIEDLYKRGIAAHEAGRTDDALRYWELVFSADPNYQKVRQYIKQEYLLRGMDAFAAGQLVEAINLWENALRADPGDEKAKGYLARARQQLSKSKEILGESDR